MPVYTCKRTGDTVIDLDKGRLVLKRNSRELMSFTGKPEGVTIEPAGGRQDLIFNSGRGDEVLRVASRDVSGEGGSLSAPGLNSPLIVGANTQLTKADSGTIITWDSTPGIITLPDSGDSSNLGCSFTFYCLDAVANTKKVIVKDTSNERFVGSLMICRKDLSTDTVLSGQIHSVTAASSEYSISFNGTTSGTVGSWFTLTSVKADVWAIQGHIFTTGGLVSPFGT